MTTEYKDKFKQTIYTPYNEAWKIMQMLVNADVRDQKVMEDYDSQCEAFRAKYPTEIGGSIYRILLDTATESARILKNG